MLFLTNLRKKKDLISRCLLILCLVEKNIIHISLYQHQSKALQSQIVLPFCFYSRHNIDVRPRNFISWLLTTKTQNKQHSQSQKTTINVHICYNFILKCLIMYSA